jgi:hypothetical protein
MTEKKIKTSVGTKKILKAHFDQSNSPIRFRSYLTFLLEGSKQFSMDHSFYVSDLIETDTPPGNLKVNSGDKFYIKRKSGYGKLAGAITTLVFLGLIYAAAQ